ncbi:MAG: hypothetical protein ACLSD6_06550 [Clostridium sp.]
MCLRRIPIEKDSAINDEIDKLRHSATALTERSDVVIIASVSAFMDWVVQSIIKI